MVEEVISLASEWPVVEITYKLFTKLFTFILTIINIMQLV